MTYSTAQKLTAEFVGTALLLAVVVGSGIMAKNLSGSNIAVALLANAIATGAGAKDRAAAWGLETTPRGIEVEKGTYRSRIEGVFAAGGAIRGPCWSHS